MVKAPVSPVAALKERLVRGLNWKGAESAYEFANIVFANPSRTFSGEVARAQSSEKLTGAVIVEFVPDA
ncbi:hypothetical protein GB928_025550 [Shinella curvata]|uniref:Uncharacterized protein n=1 Tax=Shinella curvata TaxID=1817964 RepID=A0ABT8XLH9_9HYPH|nr:hypothetical protein [Shinella curvata]MCJ8056600.1 hypothetical protein [Shinella curvata]MDO6124560.1 hypothetical protein [Shinella curvata]